MFYFHTMADFTVGQGARRKASTTVATVMRYGYERLIVNVDGSEYQWYPAECVPVAIETPNHEEESTMKYERITVNAVGTIIDWNGPFATLDEAREEAADLAKDYRGIGRTVNAVNADTFRITDPAGREPQRIIVRPIA